MRRFVYILLSFFIPALLPQASLLNAQSIESGSVSEQKIPLKVTSLASQDEPLPAGFDTENISTSIGVVTFANTANSHFAFDNYKDYYKTVNVIENNDIYEHLYANRHNGGNSYDVAWKLLPEGETDEVQAKIEIRGENIAPEKVFFSTTQGTNYKHTYDNSKKTYTLTIPAGADGDVQEIYAVYPVSKNDCRTLGKLNVITYKKQQPKVKVVSVNGNTINAQILKTELDRIYLPVGVDWQIESDTFECGGLPASFFTKSSGLFENYNDSLRVLQTQYAAVRGSIDKNTCYLFVLNYNGTGTDRDIQGFMPRGKQFGYVFLGNIPNAGNAPQIAAHELGHGLWKLRHTFDDSYGNTAKATQGTTDNLMDYSVNAARLAKWQWDIMRQPAIFDGIFDGDEEGMIVLNKDKGEFLGFSPDGHVISSRPADYSSVFTSDNSYYVNGFKTTSGEFYTWDNIQKLYVLGTKTFKGWEETNNAEKSITGKVAVWKKSINSECYILYQFIDVKDYTSSKFETIKQQIGQLDNSKWNADYTADAKDAAGNIKENCRNLFEQEKDGLTNDKLLVRNLTGKSNDEIQNIIDKLNDILSSNSRNKITESQHHLKGRILLTTTDNTATNTVTFQDGSFYVNDQKEEIANDEIVFWMEYDAESKKISVKELVAGQIIDESIGKVLANSMEWKQKSTIEKIFYYITDGVDTYFTAYYDMLDFLSSSIEGIKIPARVYDCTSPNYNRVYAEVFSYISASAALNDVMLNEFKKAFPELNQLNGDPSQIQFAFFCGMYNGLVDVFKSVPDLLKLAISFLSEKGRSDNNKFLSQIDSMEIYDEQEVLLYGKGFGMDKIWYLIVDGISGQFSMETPCVTFEFIGSIAGPVIVMCVGDAAAGTGILSKISSTAVKIIKMCDDISDPFRYMGMGLRFVKTSSGKLMATIRNSIGDVVTQVDDDVFNTRVIVDNIEGTMNVNSSQLEELLKARGETDVIVDGQRVRLAVKNTVKSELLSKLNDLPNIKNLVNRLDDVEDALLIQKIDNFATLNSDILTTLDNSIGNRTILQAVDDGQGRFLVQCERGANTNTVYSIEKNNSGNFVVHEYTPAYKPAANADIDVDLSKNLLAPDFTTRGGKYLYPQSALQVGQKNVVKIKMTGSSLSDFRAANEAAEFSGLGNRAPSLNGNPYTWHHLDDFNPTTGECTMQLTERSAHTATEGVAHSGAVAQYKTFNDNGYN